MRWGTVTRSGGGMNRRVLEIIEDRGTMNE